jgi:peptidoglycan/xylan/chitin deacetylase (PgdA/CDA1 family)
LPSRRSVDSRSTSTARGFALPRIVRLFDKYQIPVSYFIPAMSARIHPEQVDLIRKSGRSEIAVHGWIHEMNSQLPYATEKQLLQRAVDYWTKTLGAKPVGYRAPSWNFSPNTLRILRKMGFMYESSMMSDESPYELVEDGKPTGIVELPVEWIMDDAPLYDPRGTNYASPREVAQVWMDEFDRAWDEGTMFVLTITRAALSTGRRAKSNFLSVVHRATSMDEPTRPERRKGVGSD